MRQALPIAAEILFGRGWAEGKKIVAESGLKRPKTIIA